MKKRSPEKWALVGAVTLVVLLLATAGAAKLTSTDTFCIGCHAYEKVSWDHGDHPYVGCISCHTKGMFKDKTKGMRKVWLTLSQQVNPHNSPLPSYKEALTENCTRCHLNQEAKVDKPYFVERHEEYVKYAADCTGCHEPGHVKKLRDQRSVASRQR
jgi:cytochrome c nitrite reductase small subunit